VILLVGCAPRLSVSWTIEEVATGTPIGCPDDHSTVEITTTPLVRDYGNSINLDYAVGDTVIERHECEQGHADSPVLDNADADFYQFDFVMLRGDNSIYAKRASPWYITTRTAPLDLRILDDGGYFLIDWRNGINCHQGCTWCGCLDHECAAGLDGIRITAQSASRVFIETLSCTTETTLARGDGTLDTSWITSMGLPADTYDTLIEAFDQNGTVMRSGARLGVVVPARNQVAH
jgi:hypothetical protein